MADFTDQELKSLAYARHGEVFRAEVSQMVAEIRRHRARVVELKAAATEALDMWADEIGFRGRPGVDENYDRLRAVVAKDEL